MEEIKWKSLVDFNTGNVINLENLSDSEREQLMALLEKANKPKNKVWMPSQSEIFYFVTSDGGVYCDYFGNGQRGDKEILELGNCFRTKIEAEEAITRQKIRTKWNRLSIEAGEGDNPWDGKSKHWYVFYSYRENKLLYAYAYLEPLGDTFFPTEQSCRAVVKELGEENVKKYILNIKEI